MIENCIKALGVPVLIALEKIFHNKRDVVKCRIYVLSEERLSL